MIKGALSRKYARAKPKGERAYRALVEAIVEKVDAVEVVAGRAGGPAGGMAAVRAAETTAATAAMTVAVAAAGGGGGGSVVGGITSRTSALIHRNGYDLPIKH